MNDSIELQLYWHNKHNKITTDIGKWTGGEDVNIRGYSLFNDLFGKTSYMQVIVLNATGRMITKELSQWLENNFICMSYPDSRIWCNQIGAFSGALNTSPTSATVAGALGADSRAYGGSQTTEIAMKYIQNTYKLYEQRMRFIDNTVSEDCIIEEIILSAPIKHNKPAIVGFVRPVDKQDERIKPHIKMTKSLGFTVGKHMALAMKISNYLHKHYKTGINIGGYTAAFLSDQGFSPKDGYHIKNLCVASGVTACYVDNLTKKNKEFLPLKCRDIEYRGKKVRAL